MSFPNAPNLHMWRDDVRLARVTLREHLVEDSLSSRCVDTLDQLVSDDQLDSNIFQDVQLDRDALSTFPWSMESSELFDSFDWGFPVNNL